MRRFVLRRAVDATGISGVGDVAEGVAFTDGTAVVRWAVGEHRSTVVWPDVASAEAVHGHGGNTVVAWIDEADDIVRVSHGGLSNLVSRRNHLTPVPEPVADVVGLKVGRQWARSIVSGPDGVA